MSRVASSSRRGSNDDRRTGNEVLVVVPREGLVVTVKDAQLVKSSSVCYAVRKEWTDEEHRKSVGG